MTGSSAAPPLPPGAHAAILAWYDANGRRLPFRVTTDPYAILVSEVMAQQTQVSRVGEYWSSFLARFPTVAALAAATPADVLRAWRGLGYDRRGLNLWRAAQVMVARHDGRVPRDIDQLEALPGVGPYTARAVAAIAFGLPVGAVDTNVRRVLGRVLAGDADGLPPAALSSVADEAAAAGGRAADWTHAVMDVGATFCRSRPACADCPARPWCRYAAATGRRVAAARRAGGGIARPPFQSTARWLRGRIMDRLRDAEPDAWAVVEAAIGVHDAEAVASALDGLTEDGLIERHPTDPRRARLALA